MAKHVKASVELNGSVKRADGEESVSAGSVRGPCATQPWERFAETDPYRYILTSMKTDDPAEFWQSGERTARAELLPAVQASAVRTARSLELGCGVGRLMLPMARHFREVLGVDISRAMIQRAKSCAQNNGIDNASFLAISGPEDFLAAVGNYAGSCDFIYSLLVFQHIPDFSIIEGYLRVIRILLHGSGVAYLQFDTRPQTLAYRLKTRLPDALLPRFWRRGIRRVRRSPEQITASMRRAGLRIIAEMTPRSAYHRYLVRIAGNEPSST
jgi:SAM-dependent methyltransferase